MENETTKRWDSNELNYDTPEGVLLRILHTKVNHLLDNITVDSISENQAVENITIFIHKFNLKSY